MKVASITETRNGLSAILDQVRQGETFLIMDRGKPVARLEPVRQSDGRNAEESRLADLERRGVLVRGSTRSVSRRLVDEPPPKPPRGVSVVKFLLEERSEGS